MLCDLFKTSSLPAVVGELWEDSETGKGGPDSGPPGAELFSLEWKFAAVDDVEVDTGPLRNLCFLMGVSGVRIKPIPVETLDLPLVAPPATLALLPEQVVLLSIREYKRMDCGFEEFDASPRFWCSTALTWFSML